MCKLIGAYRKITTSFCVTLKCEYSLVCINHRKIRYMTSVLTVHTKNKPINMTCIHSIFTFYY